MTGSTVSLEPLSSPSPSPPPPERQHSASVSSLSDPAALDSGSELSELTEEEQEENSKAEVRHSSRPRDSKRKRSNLLPPPMWDWAYKSNKKTEKGDWRTRLVEEEEEEEQSGPAKAMEEEEDDEQERGNGPDRDPPREAESDGEDGREDDDDELPADAEALEPLRDDQPENEDATDEEEIDDDDGDLDAAASGITSRAVSNKGAASPELTDDENGDDEEAGEDPVEDDPPVAESDAEEDAGEPVAVETVTPQSAVPPVLDINTTFMDIDPIVPPPLAVPTPHMAAASSIMAGSTVVVPPSRSPSTSSSASGSPSSSRSATPEADVPSDREPEPEREVKGARASRRRKTRARPRKSKYDAAADRDLEADGDADQAVAVDVEDGDVADVEGADPDSPELELELESDLQPAHRAEALDVLATIELKFALLRERLYVEKMEALAWEEALAAEGTHPELLHLNEELSKRRDKRLELASRRRDFEVVNVMKRRKLDEDGVWSWWKAERDDLQTEMISETNRKRRKLERERRALERPQPERRMPGPPQEIRAPPTLREIVKSYPFGIASSGHVPRNKDAMGQGPLAYPQLSALPITDIARDLESLFQHRRGAAGFDPHRQMVNPALGAPVPQQFDYPMNMAMVNGPGPGTRFGPGPTGFQHPHYPEMQPPPGVQPFQPHAPRPAHHPSAVPGSLPNLHPSQAIDQDMGPHRPGSGPVQQGMHMQQFGGMAPMNGSGGLMRPRSISPVPVQTVPNRLVPSPAPPGFSQSKSNGWMSGGPGMLGPGGKEPKRPGSGPEARDAELERERYAEGQKGRDKTDREQERGYPMPMIPQRHAGHGHAHSHVHAPPGQPPHVHVVQHRHRLGPHHHHVVHHHHHPPQANGPGGSAQGPPMSALPAGAGSVNSPRAPREIEPRHIHPGASMEVDMVAGPSRPRPPSPHAAVESLRERVRPVGSAPVGPHERLMTPFTMGPSQGTQPSFPGSPRNALPPPTAPPSVGPSRRGSFTTIDESGLPRPASSASAGRPSQNHAPTSAHRHSMARRPQTPPLQPRPGTWSSPGHGRAMDYARSPPHTNGGPAPHMGPAGPGAGFPAPMRSPTRTGQPPPGMQLPPPPSLSSSARSPPVGAEGAAAAAAKNGSPGMKPFGRASSPGPPKGLSGAARPMPMGVANPEGMAGVRTAAAGARFPPPSRPSSSQALPPRIPNGAMADMHPSAPKVVPVDGS